MPLPPRSFRAAEVALAAASLLFSLMGCKHDETAGATSSEPPAPAKPEEQCDARGWCSQQLPSIEGATAAWCSVWAQSARDAWAAGSTLSHWDGVRWRLVSGAPSFAPEPRGCPLQALGGAGSNAVWAVGARRALFWDGKHLHQHALPISALAVYVGAASDAWAAGLDGLAHWDGRRWTRVPAMLSGLSLKSVYCAARGDCWAAGSMAQSGRPESTTAIVHFDGERWRLARLPVPSVIQSLSGTGENDVWAAGNGGRVFHFDGSRWQTAVTHTSLAILNLSARTPKDAWGGAEDGLVFHFDGKEWSAEKVMAPVIVGFEMTPGGDGWALARSGAALRFRRDSYRPTAALPKKLWDMKLWPPAIEELDAGERSELETYVKSLGEGRVATRAGHYEDARVAFTKALEARPDAAAAYAGRGHAAYLAKSFAEAAADLQLAAERASEPAERAKAFLELGLSRVAQGQDAGTAFALSSLFHPTAAARRQLGGNSACSALLEPTAPGATRHFADWLAFFRALQDRYPSSAAPADAAQAKALICADAACPGPSPWSLAVGSESYLVREAADGLSVLTLATIDAPFGTGCPYRPSASIVRRGPSALLVESHGGWGSGVLRCDPERHPHECSERELSQLAQNEAGEHFERACSFQPYVDYDWVDAQSAHVTRHVRVLGAEAPGAAPLHVELNEQELTLSASGCREAVPLGP